MIVDLGELGLDEGAALVIKRALASSSTIAVVGSAPTLAVDLPAWCRALGHRYDAGVITRGQASRWQGAERAGAVDAAVEAPPVRWGLAARGALVEAGAPELPLSLATKRDVWADEAARLYAQAAARSGIRRRRSRGTRRSTIPPRSRTRSSRS